jgi:hypothetical protein
VSTQNTEPMHDEPTGIEPIRTPEQFVRTANRAFEALSTAMRAKFSKSPETGRLLEESQRLTQAVIDSPFEMRGDEVIAKGFTPRIV